MLRILVSSLALAALSSLFMQTATAGCGQYTPATAKPMSYLRSDTRNAPRFILTDFRDNSWDSRLDGAIVGLWHFEYTGSDGSAVDGGNTTWFADGNEMTSSEKRAPDTGSICLGVWKQTGPFTYELNHIGLSWDTTNNVLLGPAFIKQHVILDPGFKTYHGTFAITQLAADGKTVLGGVSGTIAATRVTLDTTTQVP